MTEMIPQKLRSLEEENGFRILYACESGSRAWGFASADSDFDIRVIYSWPKDQYLGIFSPPDSFDFGVDQNNLDISCWDFRKALPLFRKSNGPLFEWLFSPIVYFEDKPVMSQWRRLAEDYFTPGHSAAHYLGLSRKINGGIHERNEVTAKKYLYVLRSLLSARFVIETESPPPVEFTQLRQTLSLPTEVQEEISAMVGEKAGGSESDRIPRNPVLDEFIETQTISLNDAAAALPTEMGSIEPLDKFFRSIIS